MAEIKDKLVTAESLKNAYDTLNNKSHDAITEVKNGISELKRDIEELKIQLNNNGIQSDWNQNDETQLDYIKNRTHYEELVETDISGMHFEITVSGYGSSWQEYRHGLNIPFKLGQTWTLVVFNANYDEVYTCEDLLVKDENGELYIGTYQDRTDKPFCISKNVLKLNTSWLNTIGVSNPILWLIGVSGTAMLNKVYQIDNKYIDFQSQCMIRDLGKLINNYKFYKNLYNSEGNKCIIYKCDNINVEMINMSDLYLHNLEYPSVVKVSNKIGTTILTNYIQFGVNAINKFSVIYGLSGEDCELMANSYGYIYKTNPTTTT